MTSRDPMDVASTIREANSVGVELVITDLQLGHSLLDRAATSRDAATIDRNIGNARHAVATAEHLLQRLAPDAKQRATIVDLLDQLRRRLAEFDATSG